MEKQGKLIEDIQEEDLYIFKKKYEDYNVTLDPTREYLRQAAFYMSKKFNISLEEAEIQVKKNIKAKGIKNPKVKFMKQLENGDRKVEEVDLLNYIRDVQRENEILAPSFTSYFNKTKLESVQAMFLKKNVKKRKEAKLLSFKYKQLGDKSKEEYYTVLQKILKILNNSLSGAYGSSSTILYNPSAHYTLTSITRSLASIGNAITEVLVGGNRLLRNSNDVLNYISATVVNVNLEMVKYCIKKYQLAIPSTDDIMNMILYSTRRYWLDLIAEQEIRDYIDTLQDEEKVAVMYTNSLWDLKTLNPELIDRLLTNMSKKCTGLVNDKKWLEKSSEGTDILARIICAKDIKGMDLNYDAIAGSELMSSLSSTAYNIIMTLREFKPLIQTFFRSNVMPMNVAYIKEILRDDIVLSDTDSTCGSYDKWVEWKYGDILFTEEAVALSAAVMLINTQAMDHNIKLLVRNMNVDERDVELLKMKNEFQWSVFTPTNNTKHYFANTCIQEGNVYKEPELEMKGVHLIASAGNKGIVTRIRKELIEDINNQVSQGKKLSLLKYVKFVADLEREIEERTKKGDIEIYKLEKIKDPNSYKASDATKTPYLYHILWETVFEPKYNIHLDAPYLAIKIPTIVDSKKKLDDFIESIEDEEFRTNLREFCTKYNKVTLPTIRIPLTAIKSLGSVPEELLNIIDYSRIIKDNLNSAYIALETIGFYKKEEFLLKEQGY